MTEVARGPGRQHTLHGKGRRLVSDDERITVRCQVEVRDDGAYGNRFLELRNERGLETIIALTPDSHIIGVTFGQNRQEATTSMKAVLRRKGKAC